MSMGRIGVRRHPLDHFRWTPKVWRHVRIMSWLGLLWWW